MRTLILFTLLLITGATTIVAQDKQVNRSLENIDGNTSMVLEGRVITDKREPVSGVNIEGPMGRYATTDFQGYFKIPANIGDEIIIRRADFETVYYRIRSNNDVEIQVIDDTTQKDKLKSLGYEVLMDSVQVYLKKDAQKTADFLIASLSNNPDHLTTDQEALAYEKLGDLYLYNKQADLAITNYQAAIKLQDSPQRQLKLAESLQDNGNYQEAIKLLEALFKENRPSDLKKIKYYDPLIKKNAKLSNEEIVKAYTALGNAYQKTNNTELSLKYFKMALNVAQDNNLPGFTSSLNTYIANEYDKKGEISTANSYHENAIEESKNDDVLSNLRTQSATADFYNKNQLYDKEIALRKNNIAIIDKANGTKGLYDERNRKELIDEESIDADLEKREDIVEIEDGNRFANGNDWTDSGIGAVDRLYYKDIVLSKQREQLKIAEAYIAKNNIPEAIESYRGSFEEAIVNGDLDIKREAARNLSKLYRENGNTSKALEYNDIYTETVDLLYEKKEQEIAINTRKAQELINRQTRILTLEKDRELTENKLALINTERELTQQINNRQRWIIYSLIALSLLLISLAYFMWRNNKQQHINNRLLSLKSLRSQMNPHFIFNALNSVNSYIAMNDERAANKYLADFSKLMRSVLENSELDFIPLSKETELLGLYLKLEHERFKDKFDYEFIVDPSLEGTSLNVPPMLLQPIIENAVWHGLRYKDVKGFLKVNFTKTENEIIVSIIDNGIGRAKSKKLKTEHQKKRESKGLGNIQNRVALLNELHNCQIDMTVQDAGLSPDTGTVVVVKMNVPN